MIKTDTNILKAAFFSSVKRGTGEAHLILKAHPEIDFSKQITKACTRNFAYDGQCERSRAPYLFELISLSHNKEKIRAAVLKQLAVECRDTWTLTQLFALAKIFAQNGDADARKAIYDRYFSRPINGSDWAGRYEILQLDGVNGLLFVAEKIGKAIEADTEYWEDHHFVDSFQEKNAGLDVMAILERASADNHYIGLFLKHVRQSKAEYSNRSEERKTFSNPVEEVLATGKGRARMKRWTPEELNFIAAQLTVEKNKRKLEKLLVPFSKNEFPLDSQFILNMAVKHGSSKSGVAQAARRVLGNLESGAIRAFALENIKNSNAPWLFTGILENNYKSGDYKLLTEVAQKTDKVDVIEWLAYDYTAIFEQNDTPECREPLEALYNKLTCALHRKFIVQILIDNNVLSHKIRCELPYDCDFKTRELIKSLPV